MDILLIQIILGILLFLLINWIGGHSYDKGYISMSIIFQEEKAPAFNFVLRVFSPLVYLIICSAILYFFGFDKYVQNFYLVNVYYIVFRLFVNIITGRLLLLNWKRQLFYWICIIGLSYLLYKNFIVYKKNLLPDFTTIANEIWIVIIFFIYHVCNNIRLSSEPTIKRKDAYLNKMLHKFKQKYSDIIDKRTNNNKIKSLIYAIIIFENFNRPAITRFIEYVSFFLTKKPHTLGVMQYYSHKYINSKQSVELGVSKIIEGYKKLSKERMELKENRIPQYQLANIYNTGIEYSLEVCKIWDEVMLKLFNESLPYGIELYDFKFNKQNRKIK